MSPVSLEYFAGKPEPKILRLVCECFMALHFRVYPITNTLTQKITKHFPLVVVVDSFFLNISSVLFVVFEVDSFSCLH